MSNCSNCNEAITIDNISFAMPTLGMAGDEFVIFCDTCAPIHCCFSDAPYFRKEIATEESLTDFLKEYNFVKAENLTEYWKGYLTERQKSIIDWQSWEVDKNTYRLNDGLTIKVLNASGS